jgi:site-specific DNA-cytosine methylase
MIKIASQFSGIGSFEQAITNLGIEHENIMAVDF